MEGLGFIVAFFAIFLTIIAIAVIMAIMKMRRQAKPENRFKQVFGVRAGTAESIQVVTQASKANWDTLETLRIEALSTAERIVENFQPLCWPTTIYDDYRLILPTILEELMVKIRRVRKRRQEMSRVAKALDYEF